MAKRIQNKDKKRAWDAFSKYTRVRDCLKTTGLPFVGVCITCEKRISISYLQAGHCLPGRNNARLFDEALVNAQCRYCNEYKHGELKKYKAEMIMRYGKEEYERMVLDSRKVVSDRDMDFAAIEKKYKEKYINLMQLNGFKTWSQLLKEEK